MAHPCQVRVPIESSSDIVVATASDRGAGIVDVELEMQDAYSTSGGLGLGLPGVRRPMDEFGIESAVGQGTTVSATKWCRQ